LHTANEYLTHPLTKVALIKSTCTVSIRSCLALSDRCFITLLPQRAPGAHTGATLLSYKLASYLDEDLSVIQMNVKQVLKNLLVASY